MKIVGQFCLFTQPRFRKSPITGIPAGQDLDLGVNIEDQATTSIDHLARSFFSPPARAVPYR